MAVSPYMGFTREFVAQVTLEQVVPLIEGRYDEGNYDDITKLHRKDGCLVVLRPVPWEPKFGVESPSDAFMREVVGCIVTFGGDWERFYKVALSKAHLSFVTGMDSEELQEEPMLHVGKWTRWGGSSVGIDGDLTNVITAYSGGTAKQDYEVSSDAYHVLSEAAREAYDRTLAEDEDYVWVGGEPVMPAISLAGPVHL